MSKKSQAAATATFGYAGVAGGAALRHHGLSDAYGERPGSSLPKVRRPALFAERRLLHAPIGRRRYAAGALLAALSAPAATRGTVDLFEKRRTFVEDGVTGVTDSLHQRDRSMRNAPAKLVAGNYLASAASTAATGAGAHILLHNRRIPSGAKAAIASAAAIGTGIASVPLQRRLVHRMSQGQYTATPMGLQRVVEPVNHGARHGSRVAKKSDQITGMSRKEELASIKRKQRTAVINAGTSVGGIASLGMLGAAALPHVHNRARLVRGATIVGTAAGGVGAFNGLESARLQRRDLKAREHVLTAKAFGLPRVPRVRTGFLRQTRTATGFRTSTVRGGLVR